MLAASFATSFTAEGTLVAATIGPRRRGPHPAVEQVNEHDPGLHIAQDEHARVDDALERRLLHRAPDRLAVDDDDRGRGFHEDDARRTVPGGWSRRLGVEPGPA